MLNTPFAPWPAFSDEEADAVARVLKSNRVNYWTGEECRAFESEFAHWCGANHAVAVSNGTAALELALEAVGICAGDEVITTSRTFLASASSVIHRGADVVFSDVDADSQNVSAETINAVATKRTRAVIAVHLAGQPCDMDPIMALAQERGWIVIEDCAQAHGATYKGRPVGSIGHIAAWSFCQDKIMTTGGEGGMVTTNDEALWRTVWALKDHGKSYAAVYEKEHPPGFRWLHESFGTNHRLTEMQAAIGRIQLGRMPDWTRQRTHNALRIRKAAEGIAAFRVPPLSCGSACGATPCDGCTHAHYKCYVFVRPDKLADGWSRDRIQQAINDAGVPCMSGSCSEVYLEKAFDGSPARPKTRLPSAKALGETSLMFLVHPTLSEADVDKTCETIRKVGVAASMSAA